MGYGYNFGFVALTWVEAQGPEVVLRLLPSSQPQKVRRERRVINRHGWDVRKLGWERDS